MRKCTIKIKLLQDSFENRFCDLAKEEGCILDLKTLLLSETKRMKMPRNISVELFDFK